MWSHKQGERSIIDSFPETIYLNQGSGSSNAAIDHSAAWNNLPNPVESQLSNYVIPSGEGNLNSKNPASLNYRTPGGWDHGESSSGGNAQNQLNGHDLEIPHGWSSSSLVADRRSADWHHEPPNVLLPESSSCGYGRNYLHRPLSVSNSASSPSSLNANMIEDYTIRNSWQGRGSVVSSGMYKPGGSGMWSFPIFDSATDNSGTSLGCFNYLVQNEDGSGSSSSTSGLSSKQKALEGSPGRSGSLNMNPHDESVGRLSIAAHYNASCSITAPPMNLSSAGYLGHLNPRIEGMREVSNNGFHPLSAIDVAESSQRNFGSRANLGQQESVARNLSAAGTDIRHFTVQNACHPSRFISTAESLDFRPPFSNSAASNNNPNQSHLIQVPSSSRSVPPLPWKGSLSLRGGPSSKTHLHSGERGTSQDETTFRNSQGSAEHSGFVSAPETRHLVPQPPNLSFIAGGSSSSRNVPSSSRTCPGSSSQIYPGSSSRSSPTMWIPHQNPSSHTQHRLPEFPQWTLFPAVEPEPGGQAGRVSPLPSGPSPSEEAVMSSGSRRGVHSQPYAGSFLMEMSNDDMNGWHALPGIEGRHRLVSEIRQVLNAMRRAENLQAEDSMFDPFIGGVAELHDRHREMRLDVDNMSYEELLALEERIGNVSTGLSEETILQLMKQRKYQCVIVESSSNLEPCCICQEDYITGDDLGTLDCGHDFHTNCIKQWLTLKNLCPICKMTALKS